MRKRGIFLLVVIVLSLFFLAVCDSAKPPRKTKYTTYADPVMGISIDLSQKGPTNRTLSYSQMDLNGRTGNLIPKGGTSLVFQPERSVVSLFVLQYYDENKWDAWEREGRVAGEVTDITNSRELGKRSGTVYVYAAPAPDKAGMGDDTKEEYQRVPKILPTIRQSTALTVREITDIRTFSSVSTTDLSDNPVDNKPFEKYQLTVVNLWGAFYSPCVEEVSDLEKLSKGMPEGTRLVGAMTDVSEEQDKQIVQQLISRTGAVCKSWVPNDSLTEYMNDHISRVPTTLFIDSRGQIVGEAAIGKRDIKKYREELTSRLDSLNTVTVSSTAGQSAGENNVTLTSEK